MCVYLGNGSHLFYKYMDNVIVRISDENGAEATTKFAA